MFGQQSSAPPAGGASLFGNTSSTPTGSGLFGSSTGSSLFGAKTQAPSSGGLFGSTSQPSGSSLFGSAQPQSSGSSLFGNTQSKPGGLFGSTPTTSQPASGGLFGGTSSAQPSGSLFGTGNTATSQSGTSSLFGGTSQPSSGGLFGGTSQPSSTGGLFGGTSQSQPSGSLFGTGNTSTNQSGTSSLFGNTAQPSSGSSLFGAKPQESTGGSSLFASTQPKLGGLFGSTTQQPQTSTQQQGPSLSLFGNQSTTQPSQTANSTVQGVKIDVTNLVPTTKFDACSDELKKEIEAVDMFILNQIRQCNEVSDLLPTIVSQGTLVPNDVEFVESKLDALQEALENDAVDIEGARGLAEHDAADAKLAFRTIDTLLLPLQYQVTGDRWWSPQQSQSLPRHSLRSALGARHTMLALPRDAEEDSSQASGGPTNLVEYFSQRADDMNGVIETFRRRLTDIENHVGGIEVSLSQQLTDAVARSRGQRDSTMRPSSQAAELAGTLEDIETAILSVAGRVGETTEQVHEAALASGGNGWNGW